VSVLSSAPSCPSRTRQLAWRGEAHSSSGKDVELLAWFRGRFMAAKELGLVRDDEGWKCEQPEVLESRTTRTATAKS
jgi:hypothetical protein